VKEGDIFFCYEIVGNVSKKYVEKSIEIGKKSVKRQEKVRFHSRERGVTLKIVHSPNYSKLEERFPVMFNIFFTRKYS